ncbi:MAG: MgtC/SapB family protein [Elusimicrobia bacterium]|nr:MgtC/SapB family protein [Elusimicrobiota bacterium]MDE2425224.1 MgtC/SapB family protein [Elusimicrobiota bacterium]
MIALLPPDALKILLTLFLCFLIGLEREEHKSSTPYSFGGVRTFPMLGLMGYALALLSGTQLTPLTVGLAVIGGFMMLSYWHKLNTQPGPGITTEVSALITYLMGALVQRGYEWIAVTIVVLSMLLLQLKNTLEGLSRRFAGEEIFAFTKFLLLSAVILPAVPDRDYTAFALNPYKTWLVVVAVSAVSYGSYLLHRLLKGRGGVLASAVLGGAYSSTVTTVTLAKKAGDGGRPHLYSGGILMASGVMYLRLIVLLFLFNRALMARLLPSFLALGLAALASGWLWSQRPDEADTASGDGLPAKNPLELDAAFLFAAIFVGVLIITHLAVDYLGRAGIYTLAGIMGLTNVDPFIMGLTQTAGAGTPLALAAGATVVAAASNNAIKGVYAFIFSERRCGRFSLLLLLALAAAGLLPLLRF